MTQMSDDDWELAGHNVPAEEFGSALADFDLIAPSPDRLGRCHNEDSLVAVPNRREPFGLGRSPFSSVPAGSNRVKPMCAMTSRRRETRTTRSKLRKAGLLSGPRWLGPAPRRGTS